MDLQRKKRQSLSKKDTPLVKSKESPTRAEFSEEATSVLYVGSDSAPTYVKDDLKLEEPQQNEGISYYDVQSL